MLICPKITEEFGTSSLLRHCEEFEPGWDWVREGAIVLPLWEGFNDGTVSSWVELASVGSVRRQSALFPPAGPWSVM